jgi:hypothetical protein
MAASVRAAWGGVSLVPYSLWMAVGSVSMMETRLPEWATLIPPR